MSESAIAAGKLWVEQSLAALAAEMRVALTNVQWIATPDGFDRGYHLVQISIGGATRKDRIRDSDLEDVTATGDIQIRLRHQLRQLLYHRP
ncbi:MAG TPA: hypothetical protein VFT41_04900 [Gemmatimonadaceae bacterium]|nr:hypothetical protein [Gemmatimonadaceae bacterium]